MAIVIDDKTDSAAHDDTDLKKTMVTKDDDDACSRTLATIPTTSFSNSSIGSSSPHNSPRSRRSPFQDVFDSSDEEKGTTTSTSTRGQGTMLLDVLKEQNAVLTGLLASIQNSEQHQSIEQVAAAITTAESVIKKQLLLKEEKHKTKDQLLLVVSSSASSSSSSSTFDETATAADAAAAAKVSTRRFVVERRGPSVISWNPKKDSFAKYGPWAFLETEAALKRRTRVDHTTNVDDTYTDDYPRLEDALFGKLNNDYGDGGDELRGDS